MGGADFMSKAISGTLLGEAAAIFGALARREVSYVRPHRQRLSWESCHLGVCVLFLDRFGKVCFVRVQAAKWQ
jgi:hypothetical protein